VKSKTLFLLVLAVTALASNVFADYDPSVDPLDPDFEPISVADITTGFTFEGRIDYDVYAPGEFNEAIALATNVFLLASQFSTQYVYQYQITSSQGYGQSVSLALNAGSGATNFGYSASPAFDAVPYMVYDAGTQVLYSFVITAGQSTTQLLLTSPYGPTAGNAMVSGMMAGSQAVVVPVPIPEPITLILLGAGCLPLRYYRRRLRKAA
jgi:hypothetical protein